MKIKIMSLATIILFFSTSIIGPIRALEIDEKLTLRILKASKTKKTILINRGLEDGLVVGDHAKFFLTTGVQARGVIVKASPTRSIWSLYRLVNDKSINDNVVMNLKVATPVRVTEDQSKMLTEERIQQIRNEPIPLAPGADTRLTSDDQNDLAELEDDSNMVSIPMSRGGLIRPSGTLGVIEIYSLLNFSSLSTSTDLGVTSGSDSTLSGKASSVDFSIGLEKYFFGTSKFFNDLSLYGFFHKTSLAITPVTSDSTGTVDISGTEYGVGSNYHFFNSPLSYQRFIGFIGFSFGVGSIQEQSTNSVLVGNTSIDGSSTFFTLGTGMKYFSRKGWGGRMMLDFYRRSESYTVDGVDSAFTRVTQGPRMLLGLSYRW